MKKNLISILLLLSFTSVLKAQQTIKHLAYRQVISTYNNTVTKLTYSKKYTNPEDSVFITNYIVYDKANKPYVYITANHNKKTKNVTVDIEDAHGGIFSHIHTEKYDYEEPTEQYFGITGNYRALGGDKYPYQLSLYFPDKSHERINLVITNATDYKYENAPYIAYILKDEMLPSKAPSSTKTIIEQDINAKQKSTSINNEISGMLPSPLEGVKMKSFTTKLSKAEILNYYLKFHEKNVGDTYFYLPALSDGSDSCILVQLEKKGNLYLLKFSKQCD